MIYTFTRAAGYMTTVDMLKVLALDLLTGKMHKKDPMIEVIFKPDSAVLLLKYDTVADAQNDFYAAVAAWRKTAP